MDKMEKGLSRKLLIRLVEQPPDVAFNTFATFVIEYDKSKATLPEKPQTKPKAEVVGAFLPLELHTHNKLSFAGQLNGIKFA